MLSTHTKSRHCRPRSSEHAECANILPCHGVLHAGNDCSDSCRYRTGVCSLLQCIIGVILFPFGGLRRPCSRHGGVSQPIADGAPGLGDEVSSVDVAKTRELRRHRPGRISRSLRSTRRTRFSKQTVPQTHALAQIPPFRYALSLAQLSLHSRSLWTKLQGDSRFVKLARAQQAPDQQQRLRSVICRQAAISGFFLLLHRFSRAVCALCTVAQAMSSASGARFFLSIHFTILT